MSDEMRENEDERELHAAVCDSGDEKMFSTLKVQTET